MVNAHTSTAPASGELRRISVLLPLPLDGAYDYLVPAALDLPRGQLLRVPLGGREVLGCNGRRIESRMQFFIDTADIAEIRELAATGLVDGVTTNPSLVAKSGRNFFDVLAEICEVVPSISLPRPNRVLGSPSGRASL